ncbi:MAG: UvrD-helicase domain-containing protein [Bacteroidetes bacterium]|nr:UvrD-helicase domain-containing protein [Bacteroidota bacterium]MBK9414770.1 UvrD-helicase domain-containing protein [Bacteroidota bacterium]MBP6426478.1 UvrD-helicase domain-containing protein [Bacteroidia bacterium]MBP6657899.1 UvrD-helicase domain-containing protein [Bacteroidia bacterium]
MKDNYLAELNEAQQAAVIHTDGPVMIIAGAGSGKTRVLTYRIGHLLHKGVDAFNILALTFTNKASKEMRGRIEKITGSEAKNLWMGTFHAVFAKILRIEAEKLGYPSNFTIYDTDDAKSLLKDIIKEQGLDDKLYKPDVVLNRISSAKNNLYSWSEYQKNVEFVGDDYSSGRPKLGQLYELYVKRCFKASGMDFDDLLFNVWVLINKYPEILHKYQHKFKYILVDEFQDTNFAQYSIVKKLAAAYENLCVVGDDAQSIYAFRGANIQNILSLQRDYPDLKVFKLEQNYRSTQVIVNAANSVIEKNKNQLKKDVWTHNAEGDKIKLMRALSDNEEGVMVANSIFDTKMHQQWNNKDFAILYRTNAQSRSMEEALRKMGIPYRIYGGLSFYKRKEIKDLLAYFRLVINHNDEEALKRIINVPTRGIGKTTIEKLIVVASEQDKSIWDLIIDPFQNPCAFNSGTHGKINEFVTMIRSFEVKLKSDNAFDLANTIATSSGLLRDLYQDKTPEGLSRYENIQELLNGIKEFVDTGRSITPDGDEDVNQDPDTIVRTLDRYMQDIALLTDADDDEEGSDDKVSLMTIHAAKGLEFPAVHVVGLEENLFPSQMSMNSREDLEEERRLFYVAITRAEKKLTISFANSRYKWGNLINCEPSRFIEEIDPKFIEETIQRPSKNNFAFEDMPFDRWERSTTSTSSKPTLLDIQQKLNNGSLKKLNTATVDNIPTFEGDDTANLAEGMEVEHVKFGLGKVIKVEGNPGDRKATVTFPGFGNKQLLLRFAKLRIVG